MVESDQGDVPGATITEAQQLHNCGSRFSPFDIKPGDIAPRLCPFRLKTSRPEHDRIRSAFGVLTEARSQNSDISARVVSGRDGHTHGDPPNG